MGCVSLKPLSTQHLLKRLGVSAPLSERDRIEQVATAFLAERSHTEASVAELRWGHLVLTAPASQAALLRYDTDVLLERLNKALPGAVTEIRVRVSR